MNRNTSKKKKSNSDSKVKKTGRIMLRALILSLCFCVIVFGGIIVSDFFFSDDGNEATPEIIAVTVSDKEIILNDDRKVTLDELRTYLTQAEEKGELYTVALINDTDNPADYVVYNQIVDLISEFDIICEKMKAPSTFDEVSTSTKDEQPIAW